MKDKKYYINLTEQERSQIIHSLIDKKNALMAQGRYTDAVDEVILKLMKAKEKGFHAASFPYERRAGMSDGRQGVVT